MSNVISPKPRSPGSRLLTEYQPNSEQVAICEQLSHMQKAIDKNQKSMADLLQMCREMVKATQQQMERMDAMMLKADRGMNQSEEALAVMRSASESVQLNTDYIIKSTLTLAYVMGDEAAVARAKQRAEEDFVKWKSETSSSRKPLISV